MTPVMLGQAMLDPAAQRTVKAAGQDMLRLPFQFELITQEAPADTIRAVVIGAPVGKDLMLVLNKVSEERWCAHALENLIGDIEAEMAHPIEALTQKLPQIAQLVQKPGVAGELAQPIDDATVLSVKLGKLRDLISMFGENAIPRGERILLPGLIQRAVDEVLLKARARKVTVAAQGLGETSPLVYVSAHPKNVS